MKISKALFSLLLVCFTTIAAFNQSDPGKTVTDKTLVVWVFVQDINQQGGSALTIDDGYGHFDGIVIGERKKQSWMAGSDGFSRSGTVDNSCVVQPQEPSVWKQVAIVYEGMNVTLYIDGKSCASFTVKNKQPFNRKSSIVFGKRHIDMQGEGYFQGKITDARIYDLALSPKEILQLKPDVLTGPEPWAWWTFTDGSLSDQTGHFSEIRISGDVKTENGCLILSGKQATVIASVGGPAKKVSAARILSDEEPIPKSVIQTTREFREKLLADPYRPAYHFCVPEDNGMPGDPNGAFFYKGRYHLMYLYSREGSGFCWGHISSNDLVHWRNHPDALIPGNGDEGVFSGGAYVTPEGKAYLSYWELWGARGIGIAESMDKNFDSWAKLAENPVIRSTEWGDNGEDRRREDRRREERRQEDVRRKDRKTNLWVGGSVEYLDE